METRRAHSLWGVGRGRGSTRALRCARASPLHARGESGHCSALSKWTVARGRAAVVLRGSRLAVAAFKIGFEFEPGFCRAQRHGLPSRLAIAAFEIGFEFEPGFCMWQRSRRAVAAFRIGFEFEPGFASAKRSRVGVAAFRIGFEFEPSFASAKRPRLSESGLNSNRVCECKAAAAFSRIGN